MPKIDMEPKELTPQESIKKIRKTRKELNKFLRKLDRYEKNSWESLKKDKRTIKNIKRRRA